MSGFDASSFLREPVGRFTDAEPEGATVAGVAKTRRLNDGTLLDVETGEILDSWTAGPETVAGVATVAATHDLPLTVPFARELNAMFSYAAPPYLDPRRWLQLCRDARKFAETKAEAALGAGWEPIELFGHHRQAWLRAYGVRSIGTDGVVVMLRGRGVGLVEPQSIEIINRQGAHARCYRAHAMLQRAKSAMIWEAFHPSNVAPPEGVLMRDGSVIAGSDYFGAAKL